MSILSSKKILWIVLTALTVICFLVSAIFKDKAGKGSDRVISWASRIKLMKQIPFEDLSIPIQMKDKSGLRYRIFKPPLNLLEIPHEPSDWQKDPLGAFLRSCYALYCDPNPTYDKYGECFLEGRKRIDDVLQKIPQFLNDEKGYFACIRSNIVEMHLLGEVICGEVHMFVYATVSANHEIGCWGATIVPKDGKFYDDPKIKLKYAALHYLSAHKYREITKHFPEYQPKKDE